VTGHGCHQLASYRTDGYERLRRHYGPDVAEHRVGDLEQVPGAGIKVFLYDLKVFLYDLQEVYSASWGLGPEVGCEDGCCLAAGKLAWPGLRESQSGQWVVGGVVKEEPAGVVHDSLVQVCGDLG
jgi:hypothetical protein